MAEEQMDKKDSFDSTSSYFDYLFPYSIRYGMTPEQYWESSDPSLFWAYRHSYILKQEQEMERMNMESWLSGLYIRQAVVSAMSEGVEYLKEPIDFKEEERKANLTDEERLQEEREKEEIFIHSEFMRINSILAKNNRDKGAKN